MGKVSSPFRCSVRLRSSSYACPKVSMLICFCCFLHIVQSVSSVQVEALRKPVFLCSSFVSPLPPSSSSLRRATDPGSSLSSLLATTDNARSISSPRNRTSSYFLVRFALSRQDPSLPGRRHSSPSFEPLLPSLLPLLMHFLRLKLCFSFARRSSHSSSSQMHVVFLSDLLYGTGEELRESLRLC
jgi:hypothetical protein